MTGAGNSARHTLLLGCCVALAAMLGLAAVAGRAPSNLLHLYYLQGLLGDDAALAQAGELAARSPRADSAPIYCQVALAQDREDVAQQDCAGFSPDAIPTLIHAAEQLGRTQGEAKALRSLQLLSSLYPDSALLYDHLSQYQPDGQPETVDSLRRALELSAQPPPLSTWEVVDLHLRLAQNYLWWEAYAPARDEAAAALNLVPDPRAYRLQALAYAYLGEFDQANASIGAAAANSNYWFYLDRGQVNAMQGRLDAAAADYRQFIAQAPEVEALQGYIRLCKLYAENGSRDAVEPCRALVGYNEADAGYRLLLGDALTAAGEYGAAAEQYRRALDIDPQNAGALDRLQKVEALQ